MTALLVQGAPISYILLIFLVYTVGSLLYQLLFFKKQKSFIQEEIYHTLKAKMELSSQDQIVKEILGGDLSFFSKCQSLITQLFWLKLLVNLSPLLGLLGTVFGIMSSTEGILNQNDLSLLGGIAESLMTTAMGIIVSVPALFTYYLGHSTLNRITMSVKERLANE